MHARCSPSLLLIMQDLTIGGRTRVQKYGFLIYQQYRKDVEKYDFYSDWIPHHFGPYSRKLAADLNCAVQEKYVQEKEATYNGAALTKYNLTISGTQEYRNLLKGNSFMNDINGMLREQQKKSLMAILRRIYADYPKYTVYSQIKDTIND